MAGCCLYLPGLTADDQLQTTISQPSDWLILEGLRHPARHDLDPYNGLTLAARLSSCRLGTTRAVRCRLP